MTIPTVTLRSGAEMPILGQGTWRFGDHPSRRSAEADVLRIGLDLGMSLIDTAEMYGEGGAEGVVGDAIAGRRDEVFLVSKVYPHNAGRKDCVEACERSLRRMRTDRLDLYLLHWRGRVPLAETLEAFQALKADGMIGDYGVSNFDAGDMQEAAALPGGAEIAANQVFYNLGHRGIEFDLAPWCREHRAPIMAYSPLDQGRLADDERLAPIAARYDVTPGQIALAWLLAQDNTVVIPKAADAHHARQNRAALDIAPAKDTLAEIDRLFPPPRQSVPLVMR